VIKKYHGFAASAIFPALITAHNKKSSKKDKDSRAPLKSTANATTALADINITNDGRSMLLPKGTNLKEIIYK
jgi:hypothetical protein